MTGEFSRTLAVLRHAKSSWDAAISDDFDRPLAPRGTESAPKMGAVLKAFYSAQGFAPDHIFCSPALRTRQTLAATLAALAPLGAGLERPPFEQELYLATDKMLLNIIKSAPGTKRHIILIGHNPGMQELTLSLAEAGSVFAAEMEQKFPTSALALFGFSGENWAKLSQDTCTQLDFKTPKTL